MIDLWQHQKDALNYLASQSNSGLLMMGVRTGKTRTTLEFIKRKIFGTVLIVGTKRSVDTWQNQNKEFGYDFPLLVLNDGSVKNRAEDLLTFCYSRTTHYTKIVVINYEAMIRKPMLEALLKVKFDCIIFDEVHKLRGHNSKQSKMAFELAKFHPKSFRLGLTGTIIYNKPLDVFGVMRFIDPSIFGIYWGKFKFHYALWRGKFAQIPVSYINQEELKNKIHSKAFIVDRRKVLDLPPEIHEIKEVVFSNAEMKTYKEFDKEFVTLLNEGNVSAKNILDKVNKLQQLTSGFIYQGGIAQHFSNAKQEALEDLLEEIGDEDVVVFYKYREELTYIKAACTNLEKRYFIINGDISEYGAWRNNALPSVLAVQISSGSEGIDLSKAPFMIFYSLIQTYGTREQALGRIQSSEQKAEKVIYFYLVTKGTIDEKIYQAAKDNVDLVEGLLSARVK